MADNSRNSTLIQGENVTIETYIDGEGPAFVILPSYGRGSVADYDTFVCHLVPVGRCCARSRAASPVRRDL